MTPLQWAAIAAVVLGMAVMVIVLRGEALRRKQLIAQRRCTLCKAYLGPEKGPDHVECVKDDMDATAW